MDDIASEARVVLQRHVQGAGVIGEEIAKKDAIVHGEIGRTAVKAFEKISIAGKHYRIIVDFYIRQMSEPLSSLDFNRRALPRLKHGMIH
ncbi:hypothetical protein, partial [Pseudomonas viridiflava]|uniref:hypothetical protein n=1 Tax=Pseudomonas viridiflava TaxID=33069 RepID=UPI0013CF3218